MKCKVEAKHILGILVAAVISRVISMEIHFIGAYFAAVNNGAEVYLVKNIGNVLAVFVFFAIIFLFFRYVKNGLGSYLLLSVFVSLMMVALEIYASGLIVNEENIQRINDMVWKKDGSVFLISAFALLYVVVLILTFVVTFQVMVKRKVNYLTYITSEVKEMETNGFGKELVVKSKDELSLLSQGISRMSKTLKEKTDREKEENDKRLQLIADLSHDLRTPLTSAIGYSELIRENAFSDPEKCNEYIEVIDRRLLDMKTMVEQLFEYTKLNQADYILSKKKTNVVSLFQYIDSEYSRIYKNNHLGWNLIIDCEKIEIDLDSEKFLRAMENLLDNAKKYAKKDTEVRMLVKQQDDHISISLSNEIEHPEQLNEHRLFDRFYKSDESRTETSGTGLGLPIVKKIIELHDGRIHVRKTGNIIEFMIII